MALLATPAVFAASEDAVWRWGDTRSTEGVEYAEYDLLCLDGSKRGAAMEVVEAREELGEWTSEGKPLLSIMSQAWSEASRLSSIILSLASLLSKRRWGLSSAVKAASSIESSEKSRDSGRSTVGERCGTILAAWASK
ncbi:hypothetical protein LTS10_001256 [Elasticomyces elasticus]|nr:hypothetical protein LTS10_001256 [Elasticomyces elasticus]